MMKKYLITAREHYTDTPPVFRKILRESFIKHLPEFALYRDKNNPRYATQAEDFIEVCNNFENIKSFLHQDYNLARQLYADGVHLTSQQIAQIPQAKALGLEVIVSTHTIEEVQTASDLGADYVTYSPIFATPNKGEPKGVEDLKRVVASVDIKVFALGGIVSDIHVKQLEVANPFGFASIRYFYD